MNREEYKALCREVFPHLSYFLETALFPRILDSIALELFIGYNFTEKDDRILRLETETRRRLLQMMETGTTDV